MRGEIDAVARRNGITAPQFSVMSVLRHEPGLSGVEVARQCMLRAQTTNEIILLLERDGLVERRPDAADRRRLTVFLTQQGWRVLTVVDERVAEIESRVLRMLPDLERAGLMAGLVRCALEYGNGEPSTAPAD